MVSVPWKAFLLDENSPYRNGLLWKMSFGSPESVPLWQEFPLISIPLIGVSLYLDGAVGANCNTNATTWQFLCVCRAMIIPPERSYMIQTTWEIPVNREVCQQPLDQQLHASEHSTHPATEAASLWWSWQRGDNASAGKCSLDQNLPWQDRPQWLESWLSVSQSILLPSGSGSWQYCITWQMVFCYTS